jgi:hypothetical protein
MNPRDIRVFGRSGRNALDIKGTPREKSGNMGEDAGMVPHPDG